MDDGTGAGAIGAALRPHAGHEPPFGVEFVRHYLRDLIYGANDGIITTFAVVAGVAGASLSTHVILILGTANLLADGFSMGASSFLSIRSDEAVRAARGEPVQEPFPLRHGAATFGAFVVAGSIPLLPFFFVASEWRFATAVAATLFTLFAVGALRALVTTIPWWRAGTEMLVVGAAAAAVAFSVGAVIAGLVA